MAVTASWFGLAHAHAFGGVLEGDTQYFIDYLSDTINVMLCTSSTTVNQDTNEFISAHSATEVAASGTYYQYGASSTALASKTLALATPIVKFGAANVSWTTATWANVRYAIIYKYSGVTSTSPLMGYFDFGANLVVTNGTLALTWGANGLFSITPGNPA